MIRIMHILTDSNLGGAGHQLLALVEKRNSANPGRFDISVVLPTGARLKPALENKGIACIELPYLAESSFSFRAIWTLLKTMKKYEPDIVHTHAALSGRIAARFYGKCKIVHTRHSVFEPPLWQTKFPIRNILGCLNNRLSDVIIAVSPAAKDNLLTLGTSAKKIRVIFNGAPPAKTFLQEEIAALREKYGILKDIFVLAQIARLTEVKGQDYVLDAAKGLKNAIILMAGDGDSRNHLERRIKKEGINNVRLLGWIDAVEEITAIMDIQISASFGTEATSMALIQGMGVGKPAVVTDYGGNPYVIADGENGLVVPIHNAQALKDAIIKLQNDPVLYAKMSINARKIYAAQFTVEDMVSKTEKLYEDLCHGKN